MRRVSLEPGYVLHTRAFRESSLIVEALSREYGRQAFVARGARSARSRWRHVLQPFRPLLLSWSQRGELGTLTGADQVASTPPLAGEALLCGIYVNELVMRLTHRGDPHPELFGRYRELLAGLSAGSDLQRGLRLFERDLLQVLGFGLQLAHEHGSTAPIRADRQYVYRPEAGPVPAERITGQSHEDRATVSGAALLSLGSGDIAYDHLPELKALMRGLIRYHLGERPLASHSLFRK